MTEFTMVMNQIRAPLQYHAAVRHSKKVYVIIDHVQTTLKKFLLVEENLEENNMKTVLSQLN